MYYVSLYIQKCQHQLTATLEESHTYIFWAYKSLQLEWKQIETRMDLKYEIHAEILIAKDFNFCYENNISHNVHRFQYFVALT